MASSSSQHGGGGGGGGLPGALDPECRLHLSDGTTITGRSFGADTNAVGELVFNTGMVGYPESLSDPSYRGQVLVLTYPLIGNYGVPGSSRCAMGLLEHFESEGVHVAGLVVSSYSGEHSHWEARASLSTWLREHNVPAMYGVDTRALTKKLRSADKTMLAKLVCVGDLAAPNLPFEDPNTRNLVAEVSRRKPVTYGNGAVKIVAVDCGMKNHIVRYFVNHCGVTLKVVPWDWDLESERNPPGEQPMDGLFISNGPGDPVMVQRTIDNLKRFIVNNDCTDAKLIPVFGICLGNQLMGLAAGCKTYKMPFGNRGMNVPVIDMRTTLAYITAQNHGYAIDNNTLPADWKCFFLNANDGSNEGLIHAFKPFFSVQFHPEHRGGPTDTEWLFHLFLERVRDKRTMITTVAYMPPCEAPIRRVLLLGSGGLSIGQAGEFDYSGSQAIKALKEESVKVILINPNIATVQTTRGMADQVYFLPVTLEFVEQVIAKERPDGILLQFGGQTALNTGIELEKKGVLAKYGVRVLGTPVSVIESTEDREIFAAKMEEIGEVCAPSKTCYTVDAALAAARVIGYPVLVRAGFALGGLGSGFAQNEAELDTLVRKSFNFSLQVIVDKSLVGWKEVEYEVVRDCKGNTITVCNMENFDPLGIHTGDSIVVAPSQTLTNEEYYMLRRVAIKVVKHLGVVGECNIQYALDPHSMKYCIIEVNARLSRSSALASKATGFPLAYVACKLSLGLALTEIKNSVTKKTCACFEPSLDYCVVKMPRWDMKKFQHVSDKIGSAMKSVGEVMSIGRSFEETFQKALRMVDTSMDGFGDTADSPFQQLNTEELNERLSQPSDQRLLALAVALQRGDEHYSVDQLNKLTHIDRWFLYKLKRIIDMEKYMRSSHLGKQLSSMTDQTLIACKQLGFSDAQIARCLDLDHLAVRALRTERGIHPWVKQIDTLAAEFPAQTNYLYLTYHGSEHDVTFQSANCDTLAQVADAHHGFRGMSSPRHHGASSPRSAGRHSGSAFSFPSSSSPTSSSSNVGVIVLGCGAYRIGSSCEFDWCAVSCIRTLRHLGFHAIMINYNPETVSTDYDECSRLYFEELSFEVVMDIYALESPMGVVVSVGGQIPNNLAIPLSRSGVKILGTAPDDIDTAENRQKFSALMDSIEVDQPPWNELRSMDDATRFASEVGYPVLVRPSYVLSGAAMNVAQTDAQLVSYLSQAAQLNEDHPVVISKFIVNAKEIEYDGVAKDGAIVNFAISEHIENAGVHSGDATLLLPAQKLYTETIKRIKKISAKIARALHITGPFNVQYLSRNNAIMVIECNLRASRSVPFVSKTFDVNFIDLATRIMVGSPVKAGRIELMDIDHCVVKVPMFSFTRLQGADPVLRVEMASTGEVACFSTRPLEAFLKGLLATGSFRLPTEQKTILLSLGPHASKVEFLPSAQSLLRMGYILYGTTGTAAFYNQHGVKVIPLDKPEHLKRAVMRRRSSVGMQQEAPHEMEALSLVDTMQHGSPSRCSEASGVMVPTPSQLSTPALTPRSERTPSIGGGTSGGIVPSVSSGSIAVDAAQLPNILEVLKTGAIELVINVPNVADPLDLSAGYHIRRTAIDFSVPLISNMKNAMMLTEAMEMMNEPGFKFEISSWDEYLENRVR